MASRLPWRAEKSFRAVRLMKTAENLAQLMTREEGKTLTEARGEQRPITSSEYTAGEGRRITAKPSIRNSPEFRFIRLNSPVVARAVNLPMATGSVPARSCCWNAVTKPAMNVPASAVLPCRDFFRARGIARRSFEFDNRSGSKWRRNHQPPGGARRLFTGSTESNRRRSAARAKSPAKWAAKLTQFEDADLGSSGRIDGDGTGERSCCSATSRAIVVDEIADELPPNCRLREKRRRRRRRFGRNEDGST